jgi:hypothetical protein
MIEKLAITCGKGSSEFLDLNHTSKSMLDSEVRSRQSR